MANNMPSYQFFPRRQSCVSFSLNSRYDGNWSTLAIDLPFNGYVSKSICIIKGIGMPGAQIIVRLDGGTLYTTTVDHNGHWSVPPQLIPWLDNGTHTITVKQVDDGYATEIQHTTFTIKDRPDGKDLSDKVCASNCPSQKGPKPYCPVGDGAVLSGMDYLTGEGVAAGRTMAVDVSRATGGRLGTLYATVRSDGKFDFDLSQLGGTYPLADGSYVFNVWELNSRYGHGYTQFVTIDSLGGSPGCMTPQAQDKAPTPGCPVLLPDGTGDYILRDKKWTSNTTVFTTEPSGLSHPQTVLKDATGPYVILTGWQTAANGVWTITVTDPSFGTASRKVFLFNGQIFCCDCDN
ncbi:hypothetical protein FACS1894184_16810 [Clostridia bacterium]|nr:hypothetical protein FACS1894184_16810 [Clostridia bacterium]